jgi:exonuclease III
MPTEADDPYEIGEGSRWPLEHENTDIEESETEQENANDDEIESVMNDLLQNETVYAPLQPTRHAEAAKRLAKGPKLGKKIGSLNMRGRTFTTGRAKGKDKTGTILKWMRDKKISVLALIDTHWSDEKEERVKETYRKHHFYCSHESTNRGGIAFVIDERNEKPKDVVFRTITPGRTAEIEIRYEHQTLHVVTAYLPNAKQEKIQALRALRHDLEQMADRNNIILTGDFNMVESDIDRNPQHSDEPEVTWEMIRLKAALNLVDGWRDSHKEEIDSTWKGNTSGDYPSAGSTESTYQHN